MKMWLSKYALSDGIKEVERDMGMTSSADRIWIVDHWGAYKLGNEVHEDRPSAVEAANLMRDRKIASLRKQIAKLEALRFE